MILGTVLVISALGLFVYNNRQNEQAATAAFTQLAALVEQIQQQEHPEESSVLPGVLPEEVIDQADTTMKEILVDGYSYIGYLSVPILSLELPVMSRWSGSQMQKAPCRYTGTLLGRDLVIMAHNYAKHFGTIGKLQPGDVVIFTDVDGNSFRYVVMLQEILQPEEVEEMTSGVFDLTLFTCTYGGKNRVTVRCNQMD